MKGIVSFIALFFALLLFTGCSFIFNGLTHVCDFTEWEIVTEADCRNTGIEERYCVDCLKSESRLIDRLEHTPADYEAKEAGCTEDGHTEGVYCSVCRAIISGIETIPAVGHTVVIDPAVESSGNIPGRTEGSHCSVCGEIIKKQTSIFSSDFSDSSKYHGDYAYNSLLTLENGAAMAEYYMEIKEVADDFHNSLSDAKSKEVENDRVYYVAEVVFSDNGLTSDEAISVWSAFMTDHPIYYWTSKVVTYSSTFLSITVDEEYRLGSVREEINMSIYDAVSNYINGASGEISDYQISLAFHDMLIESADYAYQADGVTPSEENFAHNITGVLLYGSGVCESYAKVFQMLLNYCDIENIYVTGYTTEPHAWNLVQLEDCEWYWYDLTWDDYPGRLLGVSHNYFCVTDDTLVDWYDGSIQKGKTFLDTHTPAASGGLGINYFYELPERADKAFDNDDLTIRDEIIKVDGLEYVLIGYNTLALVKINREGYIEIPETVIAHNRELVVSFIGKYDNENKVIVSGSVIYYDQATRNHVDVTGIYIPKTVEYIFDYAFDYCYTIEAFMVDDENMIFADLDGVLFTKNLYTLIKYPLAKADGSYTIPNETAHIAFGAFGDGGNVFCPQKLRKLVIPSGVKYLGVFSSGRGFFDKAPEDPSKVTVIDGYLERLYLMLGSGLSFH